MKILHAHNNQNTAYIEQKNAAQGKGEVPYNGRTIRIMPNFSTESLKPRKAWVEVFQNLRDNIYQSRLLYPA